MDQLGKALAQIAQQLGIAASALWPQLVAVTFYESLAWAVIEILFLIVGGVLLTRLWGFCRLHSDKWDERREEHQAGFFWIALLTYVVLGFFCVIDLPNEFGGILAPQGVTAWNLLKTMTGK